MKKYLTVPIIATVVMALWVLKGLVFLPKSEAEKPDIYGFAELPVLLDGRTQPIDSTARNAMRVIRHKSTALRNEGDKEKPYPAVEWLLEVVAKPSSRLEIGRAAEWRPSSNVIPQCCVHAWGR